MVSHLPYAALPCFRTTCRVAQELVDAASNGWVRAYVTGTTHDAVPPIAVRQGGPMGHGNGTVGDCQADWLHAHRGDRWACGARTVSGLCGWVYALMPRYLSPRVGRTPAQSCARYLLFLLDTRVC